MDKSRPYVETIGPFRLSIVGRPIHIQRTKDKALVAFLALHKGRAFTRTFLADLLWTSVAAAKARHSLNQSLYALRRLAPDLIIAQGRVVSCPSSVTTDVEQFRDDVKHGRLQQAAALVRGDFLADLEAADATEFLEWKDDFGRELYLEVNDTFAKLSEDGRAQTVGHSLGQLAIRIRTHTTPPDRDVPHREVDSEARVVAGRQKQLDALDALWQDALRGNATFALIRGFAGHGKTSLVDEFLRRVKSPGRVMRANCYEAERAVAYSSISELIHQSCTEEDFCGLDQIWSASLQQIAPRLPVSPYELPALSAPAAETRLFEAVAALLRSVSTRTPLIAFIDDLQWCDAGTRTLLSYISRHRLNAPILVLGALRIQSRSQDIPLPWRAWHQIEVREFTTSQLGELLQHAGNHVAGRLSLDTLERLTGGHPFLVTEVLNALTSTHGLRRRVSWVNLPTSIEGFLSTALSDLPEDANALLGALAILRRPAKPRLVAQIARSRSVSRAAAPLLDGDILEIEAGKMRFRHELLRQAAMKHVSMLARLELHRRAAQILCRSRRRLGEAAEHYYRARMPKKAYELAVRAAVHAERKQAFTQAAYYLRLAIRVRSSKANRLRVKLASALYRCGRLQKARREIQTVLDAPDGLTTQEQAELRLFDCEIAFTLGELNGEHLRDEVARISHADGVDETLVNRALRLQLRSAVLDGTTKPLDSWIRHLHDYGVQHLDSDEGALSLAFAVRAENLVGSIETAQLWAEPLYARIDHLTSRELRIHVLFLAGHIAYSRGNFADSEAQISRAISEIKTIGAMNMLPTAIAHLHLLHCEQGNYDEAERLHRENLAARQGEHDYQMKASWLSNRAMMLYDLHRFDEACADAEMALRCAERFSAVWHTTCALGIIGLVALERGELREATRAAVFGQDKLGKVGMRAMDVSAMDILIARVNVLSGRLNDGIRHLLSAIDSYGDRELICRLQLRLELARQLKAIDRHAAREHAKAVFETARTIGARPIADRADSLLYRL